MQTSLRTARIHTQNTTRAAPHLTPRQRDTRARILTHAQSLMAKFGTPTLKFSVVAAAAGLSTATLRAHFADLDDLLSALIVRHLDALSAALTQIPNDHPNRDALRRTAYLAATRTAAGTLADAHRLLVRDRHFLPEDALAPIETYRHDIGTLLAGDRAQLVLPILDNPHASADDIEALLHNLRAAAEVPPAPRPSAAPSPRRLPAEPDFGPNQHVIRPGFFAKRAAKAPPPAQHRPMPPATPPP